MNRKVQYKNKGFTLMELVISIALLSIVIIPFSNLVLNSFMITNDAKIKQQATNIAQKYMEKIKAGTNIVQITNTNTINFNDINDLIPRTITFIDDEFAVNCTVTKEGKNNEFDIINPTPGIDINAYDYRVEISEQSKNISVYEGQIFKGSNSQDIPSFQVTNNQANIIYKIGTIEIPIIKTKSENQNIIIRVDINRNFSGNILTGTAENKCSGNLIFYFVKSTTLQTDVKCQIVNLGGSIIKYDNLKSTSSTTSAGPKSRLYKIKIEVEKKGQKVINESYKTFY